MPSSDTPAAGTRRHGPRRLGCVRARESGSEPAQRPPAISQAVRGFGLRRSRYSGLAKTRLQHVATAAAMNPVRLVHWISGDPLATTRRSHLSRLINVQSAA